MRPFIGRLTALPAHGDELNVRGSVWLPNCEATSVSAIVIGGSFRARLFIRGPSGVSTTVTDGRAGAGLFGDSTTSSVKTGVVLGALSGAVPTQT